MLAPGGSEAISVAGKEMSDGHEDKRRLLWCQGWNGTSIMRFLVRFFGFLFTAGTVVFLVGVAGVAGGIWHFSRDLPDYSQLQDYEPPVMTRVHASDGALLVAAPRQAEGGD